MRFIGRLPFGDEIVVTIRFDLTLIVWVLLQMPFGALFYRLLNEFFFLTF